MFEGLGKEIIEAHKKYRVKEIKDQIISAASEGSTALEIELDFTDEELDWFGSEGISVTESCAAPIAYILDWYHLIY